MYYVILILLNLHEKEKNSVYSLIISLSYSTICLGDAYGNQHKGKKLG